MSPDLTEITGTNNFRVGVESPCPRTALKWDIKVDVTQKIVQNDKEPINKTAKAKDEPTEIFPKNGY